MNDRRTFGWDYPAGAENDPRAPWNQRSEPCDICGVDLDDCQCETCTECGAKGVELHIGMCDDCEFERDRKDDLQR